MVFRLSTLSTLEEDGIDYVNGDLSLFPQLIDDKKSLYLAVNNAETKLSQSLTYNGKNLVVESTEKFPANGLIKLYNKEKNDNYEIIYYDNRNSTTFLNLHRGFAGSKRSDWPSGTMVAASVMAEHHNSIKDAIIKIQKFIGKKENPDSDSLNNKLKSLENKHLSPKPNFRAYPTKGSPPLTIKFQNFSNNEAIRFLWDFGDGTTSTEKNPSHTYLSEGDFTVKLNLIMSTGAQGITTKKDYINISIEDVSPFFYAKLIGTDINGTTYEFIDQTNGEIKARYWVFGDGTNISSENPYEHSVRHTYTSNGKFYPSLLIMFKSDKLKRILLKDAIVI